MLLIRYKTHHIGQLLKLWKIQSTSLCFTAHFRQRVVLYKVTAMVLYLGDTGWNHTYLGGLLSNPVVDAHGKCTRLPLHLRDQYNSALCVKLWNRPKCICLCCNKFHFHHTKLTAGWNVCLFIFLVQFQIQISPWFWFFLHIL